MTDRRPPYNQQPFRPPPTNPFFSKLNNPVPKVDETLIEKIFLLASEGDITKIKEFVLTNHISLNVRKENGQNILHIIIDNSNITENTKLELIKFSIEYGANVNSFMPGNITPLHLAAKYQLPKVCEYLIKKGASVNNTDSQQQTPLFYAITGTSTECLPEPTIKPLIPEPKNKLEKQSFTHEIYTKLLQEIESDANLKPNLLSDIKNILINVTNTEIRYELLDNINKINAEIVKISTDNLDSETKKAKITEKIRSVKKNIAEILKNKLKKSLEEMDIHPGIEDGWGPDNEDENKILQFKQITSITDKIDNDVEKNLNTALINLDNEVENYSNKMTDLKKDIDDINILSTHLLIYNNVLHQNGIPNIDNKKLQQLYFLQKQECKSIDINNDDILEFKNIQPTLIKFDVIYNDNDKKIKTYYGTKSDVYGWNKSKLPISQQYLSNQMANKLNDPVADPIFVRPLPAVIELYDDLQLYNNSKLVNPSTTRQDEIYFTSELNYYFFSLYENTVVNIIGNMLNLNIHIEKKNSKKFYDLISETINMLLLNINILSKLEKQIEVCNKQLSLIRSEFEDIKKTNNAFYLLDIIIDEQTEHIIDIKHKKNIIDNINILYNLTYKFFDHLNTLINHYNTYNAADLIKSYCYLNPNEFDNNIKENEKFSIVHNNTYDHQIRMINNLNISMEELNKKDNIKKYLIEKFAFNINEYDYRSFYDDGAILIVTTTIKDFLTYIGNTRIIRHLTKHYKKYIIAVIVGIIISTDTSNTVGTAVSNYITSTTDNLSDQIIYISNNLLPGITSLLAATDIKQVISPGILTTGIYSAGKDIFNKLVNTANNLPANNLPAVAAPIIAVSGGARKKTTGSLVKPKNPKIGYLTDFKKMLPLNLKYDKSGIPKLLDQIDIQTQIGYSGVLDELYKMPDSVYPLLDEYINIIKYICVRYIINTKKDNKPFIESINNELKTIIGNEPKIAFIYSFIGKLVDRIIIDSIKSEINNIGNKFIQSIFKKSKDILQDIQQEELDLSNKDLGFTTGLNDFFNEYTKNNDLIITNLIDEDYKTTKNSKIHKMINYTNDKSSTATCFNIDIDTAKVLLQNKSYINHSDILGNTPLHYAVELQHKDLIKMLYNNYKADKNFKNKSGISVVSIIWKNYKENSISPMVNTIEIAKTATDKIVDELNKKVKNGNNVIKYVKDIIPAMFYLINHQFYMSCKRYPLEWTKDKNNDFLDKIGSDPNKYFPFLDFIIDKNDISIDATQNKEVYNQYVEKTNFKNNKLKKELESRLASYELEKEAIKTSINQIDTERIRIINAKITKITDDISKLINLTHTTSTATITINFKNINLGNKSNAVSLYEKINDNILVTSNYNVTLYPSLFEEYLKKDYTNYDNVQILNKLFNMQQQLNNSENELVSDFYKNILTPFSKNYFDLPQEINGINYPLTYIINIITHVIKHFILATFYRTIIKLIQKYIIETNISTSTKTKDISATILVDNNNNKLFEYIMNVIPIKIVKITLQIFDEYDYDKTLSIEQIFQEINQILKTNIKLNISDDTTLIKNLDEYIYPFFKDWLEMFIKEMKSSSDLYIKNILYQSKYIEIISLLN